MWAVKHMYRAITPDDLLYERGEALYIGTTELSKAEKQGIIHEAGQIVRSRTMRMLFAELRLAAHKQILEKASDIDGLVAGRLQLLTVDTLETLLTRLANHR
jgi:hypothetical protein